MQKAQYLAACPADKALLEVEGVDSQKIPVGVRGVAIFKVGDDERSITTASTRFLEAQRGPDARPRPRGLPRPPALDHRLDVGRGLIREPQRAGPGDA